MQPDPEDSNSEDADSADDRAAIAKAYSWAGRVVAVCLEMVVPGAVGFWLNQHYGVTIAIAIVGFILGLVFGIWHLLRMTSADEAAETKPPRGKA